MDYQQSIGVIACFLKVISNFKEHYQRKIKLQVWLFKESLQAFFFSLFGTFIVCFTIFKGFSWTETRSDGTIVEGVHYMQQRDSIESLYKFVLDKYDSVSIVNSEQKLIIDSLISSQKKVVDGSYNKIKFQLVWFPAAD